MKSAAVFTMILAAALLPYCALSQSAAGGQGGGSASGVRSTGEESENRSPVGVARISEQFHSVSVGGRLEPQTRIVHMISSAGFVQSIFVREGQLVQAGQELLTVKRKDDVLDLYKPVPLVARISGRVSEVLVQVEAEVSAGDPAVVVLGTDRYVLKANVSDKDAFRIDVGQQVAGRTSAGTRIKGVLESRSPEPDYSTGLFELTFQFPNSHNVSVGEFVLIDLPIDRVRGLFVPRDAVIRRYGSYYLWILSESNVLQARQVTLGPVFGDLVLITDGLEAGERYLRRLSGREREGQTLGDAEGG